MKAFLFQDRGDYAPFSPATTAILAVHLDRESLSEEERLGLFLEVDERSPADDESAWRTTLEEVLAEWGFTICEVAKVYLPDHSSRVAA